jgi:hypothetical protein
MLRSLLVSSLVLLGACAAGPARHSSQPAQYQPTRVVFHHIEQNKTMALVNEAHTDRVELYSQQRRDWSTKVAENEVMDALVDHLYGQSRFMEYAQPGPAPTSGYQKFGEAQLPNGTFHWAIHVSSPVAEKQAFLRWQADFLSLWDQVAQLQAVAGEFEFKPSAPTTRPRRAGSE